MPSDILFIGHSLVGPTMPSMLQSVIGPRATRPDVDYQVINGAPLHWNWTQGHTAEGVNARAVLPSGRYGVVIITEAIPLATSLQWGDTYLNAKRYYDLALASNAQTRFLVYETWHSLGSSAADLRAWRAQLTTDRPHWMGIVDHLNTTRRAGQPEAQLVPAGAAMATLHDAIVAGRVPGITSIRQFFSDDIHLNDLGNYFLTMVQYAAVMQRSPVGLSGATLNEWGGAFATVNSTLAAALQGVAWTTVSPGSSSGGSQDTGTSPQPIAGTAGNDALNGSTGNDTIEGRDGRDTLRGQDGNDLLRGGTGDDALYGGNGSDTIYGDAGRDNIWGDAGHDLIFGGAENDRILGGDGNDTLHGDDGNDRMDGGTGNDHLFGGEGDDHMLGGLGADLLNGGNGNDTVLGGSDNDTLDGVAGNDLIPAYSSKSDRIGCVRLKVL
jgi:Ca2+-binding RTX toxin-like protein